MRIELTQTEALGFYTTQRNPKDTEIGRGWNLAHKPGNRSAWVFPSRQPYSSKKPPASQPGALHFTLDHRSVAEQQHARRLLLGRVLVRTHRAIEELVRVKIHLEKRRPLLNLPGNQRL